MEEVCKKGGIEMDEEILMEEIAAIKGMPVRRKMHIKLKQAVPSGYPTEKLKSSRKYCPPKSWKQSSLNPASEARFLPSHMPS